VLVIAPLAMPVLSMLVEAAAGVGGTTLPAGRLLELAINTVALVAGVVVGATVIGLATAWLTTRTDLAGARVWSTLLGLPLVIPSFVGALVLLGATGRRGIVSLLLETAGLSALPIPRGYGGALFALTMFTFPYVHLMAIPALRKLDPGLEEAARGLGASPGRVFRTVTLSQMAPALRAAMLLVALYTLADFGAVSLLGYDTFTRAIFLQYAGRPDRTPATVLAALLVGIALVLIWLERRGRGRQAVPGGRTIRPHLPVAVAGIKRWLAVSFLGAVVLTSLVLPITVLVGWWLRGLWAGQAPVTVLAETWRSLAVSGTTAIIVAVAALPLAILTVRYRSRVGAFCESMAWSLYALPHITVGLAVLLIGLTVVTGLYQTLPLLLFAYLIMFLPQALGPTQAALVRVSPSLEEASRSLGKTALVTVGRITLPLMGRGMLAGAGLVFLTTMRELPATLLLRPTEFETLAVRIWSTTSEGFYTRAAVAALVLLAVSAVPLYVLVSRNVDE
jgi:iron(III) transport system permease protein